MQATPSAKPGINVSALRDAYASPEDSGVAEEEDGRVEVASSEAVGLLVVVVSAATRSRTDAEAVPEAGISISIVGAPLVPLMTLITAAAMSSWPAASVGMLMLAPFT